MRKQRFITVLLGVALLSQAAWAETAGYHLKRLEIQAKALIGVLTEHQPVAPPAQPSDGTATPKDATEGDQSADGTQGLDQQLKQATESPTWAENMALEDLSSVVSTAQSLQDRLKDADTDEYLKAKVELESLARRLRVSTAPLELSPQEKATLELTMLELDESIASVGTERDQMVARQDQKRRSRTSINIGLGYGGGWGGGWGAWGYSPWGYSPFGYGWGSSWYRPYPRYYRRGCR